MRDLRIGQRSRCMMRKFLFGVPFLMKNHRTLLFLRSGKSAHIPKGRLWVTYLWVTYLWVTYLWVTYQLKYALNSFLAYSELRLTKSTNSNKSGNKVNLMKNSSPRNNGLHDHQTSINVIISYEVILSLKYKSHYRSLWMI